MNKSELIKEVARRTDVSIKEAQKIVEVTLAVIAEHIKSGEDVKLIGFGTFATKRKVSRVGFNPRTGQRIEIKSRTVPVFFPGAQLKAMANAADPDKTSDPGEFISKGDN